MTKTKLKPKLIKIGNKRYVEYKNKRYRIVSKKSDDEIINRLLDIINTIVNKNNKKKIIRNKNNNKNDSNNKSNNDIKTDVKTNDNNLFKYLLLSNSNKQPLLIENNKQPLLLENKPNNNNNNNNFLTFPELQKKYIEEEKKIKDEINKKYKQIEDEKKQKIVDITDDIKNMEDALKSFKDDNDNLKNEIQKNNNIIKKLKQELIKEKDAYDKGLILYDQLKINKQNIEKELEEKTKELDAKIEVILNNQNKINDFEKSKKSYISDINKLKSELSNIENQKKKDEEDYKLKLDNFKKDLDIKTKEYDDKLKIIEDNFKLSESQKKKAIEKLEKEYDEKIKEIKQIHSHELDIIKTNFETKKKEYNDLKTNMDKEITYTNYIRKLESIDMGLKLKKKFDKIEYLKNLMGKNEFNKKYPNPTNDITINEIDELFKQYNSGIKKPDNFDEDYFNTLKQKIKINEGNYTPQKDKQKDISSDDADYDTPTESSPFKSQQKKRFRNTQKKDIDKANEKQFIDPDDSLIKNKNKNTTDQPLTLNELDTSKNEILTSKIETAKRLVFEADDLNKELDLLLQDSKKDDWNPRKSINTFAKMNNYDNPNDMFLNFEKANENFKESIQSYALRTGKSVDEVLKEFYGNGIIKSSNRALSNFEIEDMMKKYKKNGFKGVFGIDMINLIKLNNSDDKFSFIMNTLPSTSDIVGHWVAVNINNNTIEYFDSFGDDPSNQFMNKIIKLLKKWKPGNIYQLKINNVKWQKDNSNRCGWHSMRFLIDRYKGKSFKEATKFKIIENALGEKQIIAFQNKIDQFKKIKI